MESVQNILKKAADEQASDLFLIAGKGISMKKEGIITQIQEQRLMPEDAELLVRELYTLAGRSIEHYLETGDDDFSVSIVGTARFRVNTYRQRGSMAAVIRIVSFGIPNWQEMEIPDEVMKLAGVSRGLVLVTGPAGSGKSTTLACLVDAINQNRNAHIITIEDPIEYLHQHRMSLVSQREVPNDAPTFARALRAALRQAPDVIMLGEMRDHETMQTAITAAETGHLLLSSLHTIGAAKTIDRIVDAFPANQQGQVRIQLSMVLRAVISQRLVPAREGGQVPVFEVMTVNSAIQNMIRDGKTHQIDNVIYSGMADRTMLSMDNELLRLFKEGRITKENALLYAINPDALRKRLPM